MQCPKCNYVRQPGDQAPEYECPQCGVVYSKYVPKAPPVTPAPPPVAEAPLSPQEPEKNARPPKPAWRSNLEIISVFALPAVFFYYFVQAQLSPPSSSPETKASYAYFFCQDLVKGRLKAPATADFPTFPTHSTGMGGDGLVVIRSYVDAQNGFGAMLRTNFRCKLQYTGGDAASGSAWKFVELTMPYTDFKRQSADTPRLPPGAF